ncbi:unnamed protein product, partial [marine sediment metagenome]
MLSFSQSGDGFRLGGCGGDVEASVSFDRNDVAFLKQFTRLSDRVFLFYGLAVVSRKIDFWAALATCHCLCMKPTVGRVSKFLGTEIAHGKFLHRGVRPIVGKSLDDGISGATVGARDKKV